MKSKALLSVLVVVMGLLAFTSTRPWTLTSAPGVETVLELPDTPAVMAIRERSDYYNILIPRPRAEGLAWAAGTEIKPAEGLRLGFLYREVSIFRIPLFAWPEGGFVMVSERESSALLTPLWPRQIEQLRDAGVAFDERVYRFPVERHLWGWLLIAGFIGCLLLYRRESKARMIAAGIL